ncbi:hypothetical protein ABVT39_024063 [Epinephelus coioides]
MVPPLQTVDKTGDYPRDHSLQASLRGCLFGIDHQGFRGVFSVSHESSVSHQFYSHWGDASTNGSHKEPLLAFQHEDTANFLLERMTKTEILPPKITTWDKPSCGGLQPKCILK